VSFSEILHIDTVPLYHPLHPYLQLPQIVCF
jgi:hypothetical protein